MSARVAHYVARLEHDFSCFPCFFGLGQCVCVPMSIHLTLLSDQTFAFLSQIKAGTGMPGWGKVQKRLETKTHLINFRPLWSQDEVINRINAKSEIERLSLHWLSLFFAWEVEPFSNSKFQEAWSPVHFSYSVTEKNGVRLTDKVSICRRLHLMFVF